MPKSRKKEAPGKEASPKREAQKPVEVKLTAPVTNYEPTDNPRLFRVCDREGDWTHYCYSQDAAHGKPGTQRIFLPAVNHILTHGYAKGEAFYKYLLGTNPEEAKRTLESAGDRGARVHEAIRDLIAGKELSVDSKYPSEVARGRFEPFTNDEWDYLLAFARFVDERRPAVAKCEHSVFSLTHYYAGTVDFVGEVDWNGKRVVALLDWKTSGRIYDEYLTQVAAYYQALLELHDAGEYAGPVPTHTGIIRLKANTKNGAYEIKLWGANDISHHVKAFLSSRTIYEMAQGDEWAPDETEIPLKIKATVPAYKAPKPRKSKKQNKKQIKKHDEVQL